MNAPSGSLAPVEDATRFHAVDPRSGARLEPAFRQSTLEDIDRLAATASAAVPALRAVDAERRARFLERIGVELVALGDAWIERAMAETGLPRERLLSERARTVAQFEQFARIVREGSWVQASIDRALPTRTPQPRPDLRRMLVPIGPVAVFGASNFPFAFSTAGGDTAAALAAGNPVIVKAHPAHPGTCEAAGRAIAAAALASGMPEGVFGQLQGPSHGVGLALARHPQVMALAFTGSHAGGRALFDAATRRPEPIPVYAEMGSVNPVLLLPEAVARDPRGLAAGAHRSMTLGTGQFCTSPGLLLGLAGPRLDDFVAELSARIAATAPATMLHAGVRDGFERGVAFLESILGPPAARASTRADPGRTEAGPALFVTDAATLQRQPEIAEEVFGPVAVLVRARDGAELLAAVSSLQGQLTGTIHAAGGDIDVHAAAIAELERRVGRLVHDGWPTGVEVCASMQHGGPYPASTDARSTSVGAAAITRFVRPICYQDRPQALLPPELRDGNPRGIMRLVEGGWSRE